MIRLVSMLALGAGVLVACTGPVDAATWEDATGSHSTVLIAGAGPAGEYYIRRPETLSDGAHPVAVLLIGWGSHPRSYDGLFASLASHGVVVIAPISFDQADGTRASAAVNWLLEQNEVPSSEYFHKLIPSRVLAIGHSAGGNGALLASAQNPRIGSLLLYSPAIGLANPADVSVPVFFISGSLDRVVTAEDVQARYQQVSKAPAWYGENEKQGHTGFVSNPDVQHFTRCWVYAQLYGDQSARACFFGPNWTLNGAPTWRVTTRNRSAP